VIIEPRLLPGAADRSTTWVSGWILARDRLGDRTGCRPSSCRASRRYRTGVERRPRHGQHVHRAPAARSRSVPMTVPVDVPSVDAVPLNHAAPRWPHTSTPSTTGPRRRPPARRTGGARCRRRPARSAGSTAGSLQQGAGVCEGRDRADDQGAGGAALIRRRQPSSATVQSSASLRATASSARPRTRWHRPPPRSPVPRSTTCRHASSRRTPAAAPGTPTSINFSDGRESGVGGTGTYVALLPGSRRRARAMTASIRLGSTGLMRCASKPACSIRWRSSLRP